jgi:hypothetical protein
MRCDKRDWISDFLESLNDSPAASYMMALMRLNSWSLNLE